MTDHLHPTGALSDAVDGRLDAAEQAALDSHLANCDRCRRELDALRLTKAHLAGLRAGDGPEDLPAQLRRALDEEDRAGRGTATVAPARPVMRWLAVAATLLVAVWAGFQWRPAPVPEQVAADLRRFADRTLPLAMETTEPAALEAHLRQPALLFAARVFDFGMMNYRLVGGGVHHVADGASALFAYRGPADRSVVCQMYEGRTTTLPAPADRRTYNDIEFLVYRQNDVTLVFWQEGALVCVLAANDDPEATIRLAVAKAIKV